MRFFCFNDTATTEIYTLSLHDALPIGLRELHSRLALRGPAVLGAVGLEVRRRGGAVVRRRRGDGGGWREKDQRQRDARAEHAPQSGTPQLQQPAQTAESILDLGLADDERRQQ